VNSVETSAVVVQRFICIGEYRHMKAVISRDNEKERFVGKFSGRFLGFVPIGRVCGSGVGKVHDRNYLCVIRYA